MRAESQQGPNRRASNKDWAEMRRTNPRPTAPQSFQRPPDPAAESNATWWPVFWLFCLVAITGLMVLRQYSTAPVTSFDPSALRTQTTGLLPSWLDNPFRNRGGEPVDPQPDTTAFDAEDRLFFFPTATERNNRLATDKAVLDENTPVENMPDENAANSLWSFSRLSTVVSGLFETQGFSIVNEQSDNTSEEEAGGAEGEQRLVIEDDFRQPSLSLASSAEAGRWMMDFLPNGQAENGVYRMRVWPNTIAWTSISEVPTSEQFRLEATMQINPVVPEGYGGFLARYQDEQNYYLFLFDGQGHYRSLLRQDGQWISPQAWVNLATINLAGQVNEIALEESRDLLRLYANGVMVDEVQSIHPSGDVGLVAGAKAAQTIEVDYDRVAIYELY